jgi:L-alanine-DL-glutamate epimerase-like enolase superfamily enzyme
MQITAVEAWLVSLRLTEPYTIAYETIETATNILVRIDTTAGLGGFGCTAPDEHVTGESPETVLQHIQDAIAPELRGTDPRQPAELLTRARSSGAGGPAAIAAIDIALMDLAGKLVELPLWRLLGGARDRIATSVTIGILPEIETVERARELVSRGFSRLKLKGGRDVESDIGRMIRVREVVGGSVGLCFDANQGYSVEESSRFMEGVQDARVEFLEQPTSRERLDDLEQVKARGILPVMADESLVNSDDMKQLATGPRVDLVNIKLTKVGGIEAARRIDTLAKNAGIHSMVGCMDETALGIAAGLHFALGRPNVRYADLDGHLDLIDDPTVGAVQLRDGVLYPSDGPGLGFEPS